MNKFYDTSSLMLLDAITEPIIISSITLQELEDIKSHFRKDEATKAAARHLLHELYEHFDLVTVIHYEPTFLRLYDLGSYELNNDIKILATALYCNDAYESVTFYTNDLAFYALAALYFDADRLKQLCPEPDCYSGYLERTLTEQEFIDLYENL